MADAQRPNHTAKPLSSRCLVILSQGPRGRALVGRGRQGVGSALHGGVAKPEERTQRTRQERTRMPRTRGTHFTLTCRPFALSSLLVYGQIRSRPKISCRGSGVVSGDVQVMK